MSELLSNQSVFSHRLAEARKDKKLTQKELAALLGMTPNAYQKYELGTREPSLIMLITCCTELDVSADYLLGLTDYHASTEWSLKNRIPNILNRLNIDRAWYIVQSMIDNIESVVGQCTCFSNTFNSEKSMESIFTEFLSMQNFYNDRNNQLLTQLIASILKDNDAKQKVINSTD